MIVEKKHLENFTILYVEGLIKLGESAEFFSSALENVLKNESTNVIIDVTKIDYIDCRHWRSSAISQITTQTAS